MVNFMTTHEVIICTRNRAEDLSVALASLGRQTRPADQITIVDSSDGPQARAIVEADAHSGTLPMRYFHTEPGLPLQRNFGLRRAIGDIVHFIDDDVVLGPHYLEELASTFDSFGDELVGAGGLIDSTGPRHPRMWWRAAMLDSRRQGVVLPSGFNVIVTDASEVTNVEWLSGCSMAYRRFIFEQIEFDEGLAGYALMEDVDFSFRAARLGRLVVNPRARLEHKVSEVERWDHERRTKVGIHRRGWFVTKHLARKNLAAFVWSVVAGAAINAAIGLGTLSRWRLRVAAWQLTGLVEFFRGCR